MTYGTYGSRGTYGAPGAGGPQGPGPDPADPPWPPPHAHDLAPYADPTGYDGHAAPAEPGGYGEHVAPVPRAPAFGGYQAARTAPWGPPDDGRGAGGGDPARPAGPPPHAGGPGGPSARADGDRWDDDRWDAPPRRKPARRRRALAVGLLVVVAASGLYARSRVEGGLVGGRALGVLTGDATALVPELVAPDATGAPGAAPLGPDGGAADGGPTATVVTPGSDGVVGTDDDVVVPAGGARGGPGSSTAGDTTTEIPGTTTSTSTTLPPIPTDLAISSVAVPATAPGSTDACGRDVAFDAGRITDDRAETAWRMEGDATGQEVTLSLGGRHRIVSVGMIPGYALTDPCDGADRFRQNRRITKVTWIFDDGSAPVVQELRDAAEMQRVAVSAESTTVTVRIEGVTGEPERDFTAISEIDVRGT